MTEEAEYHFGKLTNKTYISSRKDTNQGALRYASKVMDSEGLEHVKVKSQIVLKRTPKGRTEIIAKFFEDDRRPHVVTLQTFNGQTGMPQKRTMTFWGSDVPKLLTFFQDIAAVDLSSPEKLNLTDNELHKMVMSRELVTKLALANPELFAEVMNSDLTKEEFSALGHRKRQLKVFTALLDDPDYFERVKEQKGTTSDEALWQAFFQKNQWVFGYGLSYLYVTGFENAQLEQLVKGADFISEGKRVDALLKTRGIINALCFVEIKKHTTPLLGTDTYRAGCWAPSRELAGAVAQVQGTVAAAMHNFYGLVRPETKGGDPTGEEVFNFKPKAFIVIGSLSEFKGEHGVNVSKMRSFELYRNCIVGIEILTFDELHERSKFIVRAEATAKTDQETAPTAGAIATGQN